MTSGSRTVIAGLGVFGAMAAGLLMTAAAAQDAKKATPIQPAPAQANIPAWTQTVNKDGSLTLDEKQIGALKRVSGYFNDLKNLKGSFVQFNPDGKRMRGKFSMKRPGKFRFDYGFGSKMIIISDGTNLAIQDHDINSESNYQLDQTPFRILLRKDVDLIRDGKILDVQESDDLIVVNVQDRSPDTVGRIKLFLSKKGPALDLKEWVTTDAQGLDTRVEVNDLNKADEIDAALFKIESVGLKALKQNN